MKTAAVHNRQTSSNDLDLLDRYWCAANYLSVGQIYLLDNPLLQEPLRPEHIKPRLLGHWGTTPGLNFIYAHLNRRSAHTTSMSFTSAGPAMAGPAWSLIPILKAPTARSIPISAGIPMVCASYFASFPSRRHSEPRRPGDAGLDPRGRRTRLRAGACLWRGFRQP